MTEDEAVIKITQCEWARYFNQLHPGVGYLLGCSMDESGTKSYNKNINLQRTQTIVEGSEYCNFRYFVSSKDKSCWT